MGNNILFEDNIKTQNWRGIEMVDDRITDEMIREKICQMFLG